MRAEVDQNSQLMTCFVQTIDDLSIREDSRHSRAAFLCELPALKWMSSLRHFNKNENALR